MAATRMAIVHFKFTTDVSLASALVTLAGVSVPLILHALVRETRLKFLFERPAMFRLAPSFKTRKPQPAQQAAATKG
jgi:hypothetical protein